MKAFLFPGQGSQSRGMGEALFDSFQPLVQKADKILGYSIKELCLEDPRKELNQTQFTQPAMYVVSALSYFASIANPADKPDFVAGHSLGEFNALLAAECFDFETGLKLVKKRGELMSGATGGGMAAILGSDKATIERVLQANGLNNIDLANFNCPSQIVVSGSEEQIMDGYEIFKDAGVKYIPLNTSGAFHSRLMQSSKDAFEAYLSEFEFADPKIPVISNVTAQPYLSGQIKTNLVNQITSSVRWCESIQYLMAQGDVAFEEVGHGDVLTKLLVKIKKELPQPCIEASSQATSWLDKIKDLSTEEKVKLWNETYPISTHVKSTFVDEDKLETRGKAVVLFGHRSAVYMKGFNGYFDLDQLVPDNA
ncbi:MAG: [acyl-carrier-protein] S-malonyltransferase [Alteromonadaceae bacterium]|nr:MAG: [acyl-carrier-protein] S-malonyltransferase [Alteromonadaceae bacterium]